MMVVPAFTFGLILRYLYLFKSEEQLATTQIKQSLIPLDNLKADHQLLNDKHMASRLIRDPDVAAHSIMISGIPTNLSTDKVEQEVGQVMREILKNETLPEDQLVAVHAVTNLDVCVKLYQKLIVTIGRYKMTQQRNLENPT